MNRFQIEITLSHLSYILWLFHLYPTLVRIKKCDEIHNSKSTSKSLGTVVGSLKQVPAQKLKRNIVTCFLWLVSAVLTRVNPSVYFNMKFTW